MVSYKKPVLSRALIICSVLGKEWGLKSWAPKCGNMFLHYLCLERGTANNKGHFLGLLVIASTNKMLVIASTNAIAKTLSTALNSGQSPSLFMQ